MSACQTVRLDTLMDELKLKTEMRVQLMIYNKSAINLALNLVAQGRSKHIQTRFHYIRDQVSK
ncbi:hypothetical protein TanjilG_14955 [Lupinus angustifolius]|uniref:Copia protein n=1 Tax=Lupinus angustifolius TaxID=3871 RepID=A0A394DB21_LUPAN|nr:hypothetical protein TanjilG_14955 [Lupinus angustifolius]